MAEYDPMGTLKRSAEIRKREREQEEREVIKQMPHQATPPPTQRQYCEHPDAMGNGMATMLYIVVMIGGSIFNDRWLIWIVATILWLSYLAKHES